MTGIQSLGSVGDITHTILQSLIGNEITTGVNTIVAGTGKSLSINGNQTQGGLGTLSALGSSTLLPVGVEAVGATNPIGAGALLSLEAVSSSGVIGIITENTTVIGTIIGVEAQGASGNIGYTTDALVLIIGTRIRGEVGDFVDVQFITTTYYEDDWRQALEQITEVGVKCNYRKRLQTVNPDKPWLDASETITEYDCYIFWGGDLYDINAGQFQAEHLLYGMMAPSEEMKAINFDMTVGDTIVYAGKEYTVKDPINTLRPNGETILFNFQVEL